MEHATQRHNSDYAPLQSHHTEDPLAVDKVGFQINLGGEFHGEEKSDKRD